MKIYNIPNVKIYETTKIVGIENIEFGNNIIIDDFVFICAKNKIIFRNNIHIASFTSITGGESFVMDDCTGLSSGVRIVTGSDDFKDWGFGNPTINEKYRNTTRSPVRMEKFSIVGSNAVILPGVIVGEGCAVCAGSVVSKNLSPWGIYVGNKRVGERNKEAVLMNYHKFLQDEG